VTSRDRLVVMVFAALAALGAVWFLALAPKRKEASKLGADIAVAQEQLRTAQQAAQTATADKARYATDYAMVARLGKAVPASDDVPSLLYQLQSAASDADVDFRAIRLESRGAAPVTVATPAAAAAQVGNAEKAGGTAGGSGTDANAATATPVAATESAAATLPPGASVGPAGFPTMPFSFTFQGGFSGLEEFLDRISAFTRVSGETIRVRGRLLTIDGVGLSAGPEGFPQMRASISATAYLLPPDQATVPATPDAAVAAAASGAPTSVPAPASATGATGGGTVAPAATLTPGGSR